MFVKDFMSKDVISLMPEDNITKFVGLMEKYNIHEAPVIDKGIFLGMINYKEIASRGIIDPSKTKIEKMITKAPVLSKNTSIEEASEFLFKKGFRALPVVEENKIIGMFSVFDLLKGIDMDQMRRTSAEEIMSTAEVINEHDDIGKARVIMRENNISKLPVVNDNGKLSGIVSVLDLLKAVKPRERMNWYSMAAEKLTTMKISISTIMKKDALTSEKTETLLTLAEKMVKAKDSGVVITENGGPLGIVTTRDILEFYLSQQQKGGVYVQIIGLEKQNMEVDRIVAETVKKISLFYPIQYMYLHIKKHRKNGREKYSIRCRLMTDMGMFMSRANSWNLPEATGFALENLERLVLKEKIKTRDKVRKFLRLGK